MVSAVEGAALGGAAGLAGAGTVWGASRFFAKEKGAAFRSRFWKGGEVTETIYKDMNGKKISEKVAKQLAKNGELFRKSTITKKVPGWGRKAGKIGLAIGLVTFIGREIFNRTSK